MPINSQHTGAITGAAAALFILTNILFWLSWDNITPFEVGILIDNNTRTYDKAIVYPPGRYFVGLGKYFFRYPISFQPVEFDSNKPGVDSYETLTLFTSGGQTVYADVSLYYRIDETKVIKIFETYKYLHDEILTREMQDIMKIVGSNYTVEDFFSKREIIAKDFENLLNANLYPKYFVWISLIQLRNIGLPAAVEASRVELVVAAQNTKTSQLNRDIVLIQKDTEILKQQYQSNQTIAIGQANSQGYTLEQSAIAEGSRIVFETEASALKNFTQTLSLNTTQLVSYSFLKYMKAEGSKHSFVVGFGGAVPIVIG